jgi:hypothetical protein
MRRIALTICTLLISALCYAGGGGDFPPMPPQDIPQDTLPSHLIHEPEEEEKRDPAVIVALVTTTGTIVAALITGLAVIAANRRNNRED